jgi:hypothetical protein
MPEECGKVFTGPFLVNLNAGRDLETFHADAALVFPQADPLDLDQTGRPGAWEGDQGTVTSTR